MADEDVIRYPLANGGITLIDANSLPVASRWTWRWLKRASGDVTCVLARDPSGRPQHRILHREIMQPPKGFVVDHINGDPLDNRRANLRICRLGENLFNKKRYRNNSLGVKGVYQDGRTGLFIAQIRVCGKKIVAGYFRDLDSAAKAYAKAAKKYHGEFARVD